MLTPNSEQRDQIELFFSLITEKFNSILLHPIVDEKTGVERLGICVVDREGPDENNIYLLGLWFLPGDKLFDRFSFKESSNFIIEKPHWLKSFISSIAKKIKFFNA